MSVITKSGKELSIKTYNNFNVVYGTVDDKNPKAIYVFISGWVTPRINSSLNYDSIIKDINKDIKNVIHYDDVNSNLFNLNRYIVDFDIRTSGLRYGKKSYMSCEITLFQKHNYKLKEVAIRNSVNNILDNILNKLLSDNKYFKFHKRKK